MSKIKTLEELYHTLGCRETYGKSDIEGLVDLDALRKDKTEYQKPTRFTLVDDAEYLIHGNIRFAGHEKKTHDSIEALADGVRERIVVEFNHHMNRIGGIDNLPTTPISDINLNIYTELGDSGVSATVYYEPLKRPETDNEVIKRVLQAMRSMAKKEHDSLKKEKKKEQELQKKVREFEESIGSIDIPDDEKERLINAFRQTNA